MECIAVIDLDVYTLEIPCNLGDFEAPCGGWQHQLVDNGCSPKNTFLGLNPFEFNGIYLHPELLRIVLDVTQGIF